MPDPDAEATFDSARLDRTLRHAGDHAPWALHRALIGLRRSNPRLRRSRRTAARASRGGRVTLARSHPLDAVVALFNVSAEPAEAVSRLRRRRPGDAGARWAKLIDIGGAAFGGQGETLPTRWRRASRSRCAHGSSAPTTWRLGRQR